MNYKIEVFKHKFNRLKNKYYNKKSFITIDLEFVKTKKIKDYIPLEIAWSVRTIKEIRTYHFIIQETKDIYLIDQRFNKKDKFKFGKTKTLPFEEIKSLLIKELENNHQI